MLCSQNLALAQSRSPQVGTKQVNEVQDETRVQSGSIITLFCDLDPLE